MSRPQKLAGRQYDYSGALRVRDLLHSRFLAGLDFGRTLDARRRRKAASAVLLRFLELAQRRLLEKGDRLLLPCHPLAVLYICEKTPLERLRIRRNRRIYRGVNPVLSDGKLYEYVLYLAALRRKVRVRIPYTLYQELVGRVNAGQRYYVT